jgi:hypothetical protein
LYAGEFHPQEERERIRIPGHLFFPASIIQDHLVQNLSAADTPPAKKAFMRAVKLLEGHHTLASRTVHLSLLKILDTCTPSYKKLEKRE